MIVLDASALFELLLDTVLGRLVAKRAAAPTMDLHIPHLADLEIAQALRQYVMNGRLAPSDAAVALENLHALDLQRHAHEPLLDRVWHLRKNLTAYDAVYVALSEVLDAVLLTCDGRLARAPGGHAKVELVRL